MKISKKRGLFGIGRRFVFTLALFLLVFAAASVVKIQAAGNVTGWLWGGSEDANIGGSLNTWPPDGNETGVGEVRMSGKTQDGLYEYGVNIPSSDGPITGGNNYAWSENIGWVDFDGVTVATAGDERRLSGQARIIAIRDAGVNAGGWQGWIKLAADGTGAGCAGSSDYSNSDRCNYGVKIDSSGNFSGYGWNGEEGLAVTATQKNMANGSGWINFKAKYEKPCTPLCGSAVSQTFCAGDPGPSSNLCAPDQGTPSAVSGSGPWSWTCDCGGSSVPCTAGVTSPEDGQCGTADGGSFCSSTPTDAELCAGGTHPSVSLLDFDSYEVTWTCTGVCSTVNDTCSAKGKKACGWIETNP